MEATTTTEPSGMAGEKQFGNAVRQLRESLGMSQGRMAMKMIEAGWVKFYQTTISRIEKNERPVRLGEALAMAEILGVSLDVLAGGDPSAAMASAAGRHTLEREVRESRRALELLAGELSKIETQLAAVATRHEAARNALNAALGEGVWMEAAPDHLSSM